MTDLGTMPFKLRAIQLATEKKIGLGKDKNPRDLLEKWDECCHNKLLHGIRQNYLLEQIRVNASENLKGRDFSYVDFNYLNMREINFNEANLSNSVCIESNFNFANLKNSNLKRTDFERAILDWSNLTNADCSDGKFRETSFCKANLSGANFSNANLEFSDLRGVIIDSNTNFNCADLRGAKLGEITAEEIAIFQKAKNLDQAEYTEIFDLKAKAISLFRKVTRLSSRETALPESKTQKQTSFTESPLDHVDAVWQAFIEADDDAFQAHIWEMVGQEGMTRTGRDKAIQRLAMYLSDTVERDDDTPTFRTSFFAVAESVLAVCKDQEATLSGLVPMLAQIGAKNFTLEQDMGQATQYHLALYQQSIASQQKSHPGLG